MTFIHSHRTYTNPKCHDVYYSGALPFSPTIGDVDGDGQVDVVAAAVSETGCHIWAVNGQTGRVRAIDSSGALGLFRPSHALHPQTHLLVLYDIQILQGYPIALPDKSQCSAPLLLVDLHDYKKLYEQQQPTSGAYRGGYVPSYL